MIARMTFWQLFWALWIMFLTITGCSIGSFSKCAFTGNINPPSVERQACEAGR
ncbi:MAG: hypothetical protein RJA34_3045 [Pseudomonadota bacterium]|jgi:hypothetical protein